MQPHEYGILPAVLIVSRTDALGLKMKMTIKRNGPEVAAAYLQKDLLHPLRPGILHNILQKFGGDSPSSSLRIHRKVEDVGLFGHQPEAKIPQNSIGNRRLGGNQEMGVRKEELLFEKIPGPGRGEGSLLDGKDLFQITLEHAADFDLAFELHRLCRTATISFGESRWPD